MGGMVEETEMIEAKLVFVMGGFIFEAVIFYLIGAQSVKIKLLNWAIERLRDKNITLQVVEFIDKLVKQL